MDKQHYVKAVGIPLVAIGWAKYGDQTLNFVSTTINNVASYPFKVADWYKPSTLVGVALASQIFVKPVQEHSPVVNFVIKTATGLIGYYLPFTAITESANHLIKDFSQLDNYMKTGVACTVGAVGTAIIDNLILDQITSPLNKGAKHVDNFAAKTIAITATVLSSIIGSKAETIDINYHETLHSNQTITGSDNYIDNLGTSLENLNLDY